MPPASLSTFAVMMPGPTTAKTRIRRVFQDRRRGSIGASVRPAQDVDHGIGGGEMPPPPPPPLPPGGAASFSFPKDHAPPPPGVPASNTPPRTATQSPARSP